MDEESIKFVKICIKSYLENKDMDICDFIAVQDKIISILMKYNNIKKTYFADIVKEVLKDENLHDQYYLSLTLIEEFHCFYLKVLELSAEE